VASPREAPNAAVRRFATVWVVSLAVKVAAVALLVYLAVRFLGGA
jgi:hypothetical protein